MRTPEQILDRIEEVKDEDYLGCQRRDLCEFLPLDKARPFFKDEASDEEVKKFLKLPTENNIKREMQEYLEFAWGKATDHRGLSAERSIEHFTAWVWLLGDEELMEKFNKAEYKNYGAPQLKMVSDYLGYVIPGKDAERMAKGLPCRDGCEEGCGR